MRSGTGGRRAYRSVVCLILVAFALVACDPDTASMRSGTPTGVAAPASIPPPTRPIAPGTYPTIVAAPTVTSLPALPTPRTPAAISLTAMAVVGAAPLTVAFTITIPAGVGTGCEADVYIYGDGQDKELYLPCGIVVSPVPPGSVSTPIVLPTWPPRSQSSIVTDTHTYRQPGVYAAQFALREKPSARFTEVSNIVTITVT